MDLGIVNHASVGPESGNFRAIHWLEVPNLRTVCRLARAGQGGAAEASIAFTAARWPRADTVSPPNKPPRQHRAQHRGTTVDAPSAGNQQRRAVGESLQGGWVRSAHKISQWRDDHERDRDLRRIVPGERGRKEHRQHGLVDEGNYDDRGDGPLYGRLRRGLPAKLMLPAPAKTRNPVSTTDIAYSG